MVDTTASSEHRTDVAPAAPDRAPVDLAPVDDAILTLLAKRLARALLLDADDEAGPDTTGRGPRPA